MVKVYFEQIGHGPVIEVATFKTEEIYSACYPSLERMAEKNGMILTEKVEENEHSHDSRI